MTGRMRHCFFSLVCFTSALLLPLLASVLIFILVGCSATRSSDPAGLLVAEAHGVCPSDMVNGRIPLQCRLSRIWNGTTPLFKTPLRQWGVAYAFNCGSRPRRFSFAELLPGMDHMSLPGVYVRARQKAGSFMISKKQMVNLLKTIPAQFTVDGKYTSVVVETPCTWHVKAILGTPTQVRAAIPPIPRVESPWWRRGASGE